MANIPAARSPFIGRHAERALIRDILTNQEARLLTLTGPGGVGKTRLAKAIMAELAPEFVDGAEFVPLEGLGDADLVLAAIARAIGMPANGAWPVFERLRSRLADANVLLVLDHLEPIAAVTRDVAQLLEICQPVMVLATSRTPLRIDRELEVPLSPLPYPDKQRIPPLDELRANEAVSLLVRRAQATDSEFALTEANAVEIVEICARTEGMPLALELAAAQLRALASTDLRGRPLVSSAVLPRGNPQLAKPQRALRDMIAWTDRRMSPANRVVFHCLSVFAGGCNSAAAEAVCGNSTGDQSLSRSVFDALAELLEHGLLNREVAAGESRFTMAETVREYARERLEAAGKSEMTLSRHADYCLALAQEMATKLLGLDQEICLARLDREYLNFRVALSWSLAHSPTVGLRLAAQLWRYFFARGSFNEGQRWLEAALATPEAENDVARVRALNGLGVLFWATGNLERALELQNASFSLACEIDDAWGMAAAQGDRAIVEFMNGGDANQARKATMDALKKFRTLGDRVSEGLTLIALGSIAQSKRNLVQAAVHFQEALTITRQNGDLRGQALSLFNLGQTARLSGDLRQASAWHHEGLAISHRMGLQEDMLYSLVGIAGIAVERGQFRRAARLLGAVTALAGWMAIPLQPTEKAQVERDVTTTRAAMSEEIFRRASETGRGLALEDAVAEALEITQSTKLLGNGHELTKHRRNGQHSENLRDDAQDAMAKRLQRRHGSGEQLRNTHGLSQRELEVLLLLAAGKSDREIAEQLFISCQTAMTHVKHIRAKLAVHSRAAAAAYAIRHGIV